MTAKQFEKQIERLSKKYACVARHLASKNTDKARAAIQDADELAAIIANNVVDDPS